MNLRLRTVMLHVIVKSTVCRKKKRGGEERCQTCQVPLWGNLRCQVFLIPQLRCSPTNTNIHNLSDTRLFLYPQTIPACGVYDHHARIEYKSWWVLLQDDDILRIWHDVCADGIPSMCYRAGRAQIRIYNRVTWLQDAAHDRQKAIPPLPVGRQKR